MFSSGIWLSVAILVGFGAAQSSTSSAGAASATHVFSVGANGKTFTPRSRTVPVGDIVEFRFYPQNHSVVRAEFGPEPCIPYELTGAGKKGWWTGWQPTAIVDTATQPTFRIRINDSEPLALYCASPGSCLHGMIAVINGNATHNYETQLAYTRNATAALAPGEYWPEEKLPDDHSGFQPGGSQNDDKKGHPHSLSAGAIAGIAVGGAAVLLLGGALIYMCGRHKSFKDLLKQKDKSNSAEDGTAYQPASPGLSEAHYPNIMKSPAMTDSRFSAMTYSGADSYRSVSPPPDERTHSLYGVINGYQSPGVASPSWPSPRYEEMHEADSNAIKPPPPQPQVHEMPAPLPHEMRSPDTPAGLSFTNSESGYTDRMRDTPSRPHG